jgi:hypothetical protein
MLTIGAVHKEVFPDILIEAFIAKQNLMILNPGSK